MGGSGWRLEVDGFEHGNYVFEKKLPVLMDAVPRRGSCRSWGEEDLQFSAEEEAGFG